MLIKVSDYARKRYGAAVESFVAREGFLFVINSKKEDGSVTATALATGKSVYFSKREYEEAGEDASS